MFRFPLKILPEIFLILRRTERDMIKEIYFDLHVNYPLFLSKFNETRIFSTDFRKKKIHISNLMKFRPVRAGLHAVRRMDRRDEGISRF